MRKAEVRVDLFDAPLAAAVAIDDAHGAILDADIVQHNVTAGVSPATSAAMNFIGAAAKSRDGVPSFALLLGWRLRREPQQ